MQDIFRQLVTEGRADNPSHYGDRPLDDWIKAQVKCGRYTNDSEYIRDLVQREQERVAEIEAVRAALEEGEKSGKPTGFDANAFKRKMRCSYV
jgi:antitoxin ParD1/3/4